MSAEYETEILPVVREEQTQDKYDIMAGSVTVSISPNDPGSPGVFPNGRDGNDAIQQVQQRIMAGVFPMQFMDHINSAQSQMGNRAFLQFIKGLHEQRQNIDTHSIVREGISGNSQAMTHLDRIQNSFGHHDVSGMREYTDPSARAAVKALGADAYSSNGHMAFADRPSLFTQAHEAAHGVQQSALGSGLQLKGGIGETGDRYEQHADAVADAVVRGESAQGLLDQMVGVPTVVTLGTASSGPVQMSHEEEKDKEYGKKFGSEKKKEQEEEMELILPPDLSYVLHSHLGQTSIMPQLAEEKETAPFPHQTPPRPIRTSLWNTSNKKSPSVLTLYKQLPKPTLNKLQSKFENSETVWLADIIDINDEEKPMPSSIETLIDGTLAKAITEMSRGTMVLDSELSKKKDKKIPALHCVVNKSHLQNAWSEIKKARELTEQKLPVKTWIALLAKRAILFNAKQAVSEIYSSKSTKNYKKLGGIVGKLVESPLVFPKKELRQKIKASMFGGIHDKNSAMSASGNRFELLVASLYASKGHPVQIGALSYGVDTAFLSGLGMVPKYHDQLLYRGERNRKIKVQPRSGDKLGPLASELKFGGDIIVWTPLGEKHDIQFSTFVDTWGIRPLQLAVAESLQLKYLNTLDNDSIEHHVKDAISQLTGIGKHKSKGYGKEYGYQRGGYNISEHNKDLLAKRNMEEHTKSIVVGATFGKEMENINQRFFKKIMLTTLKVNKFTPLKRHRKAHSSFTIDTYIKRLDKQKSKKNEPYNLKNSVLSDEVLLVSSKKTFSLCKQNKNYFFRNDKCSMSNVEKSYVSLPVDTTAWLEKIPKEMRVEIEKKNKKRLETFEKFKKDKVRRDEHKKDFMTKLHEKWQESFNNINISKSNKHIEEMANSEKQIIDEVETQIKSELISKEETKRKDEFIDELNKQIREKMSLVDVEKYKEKRFNELKIRSVIVSKVEKEIENKSLPSYKKLLSIRNRGEGKQESYHVVFTDENIKTIDANKIQQKDTSIINIIKFDHSWFSVVKTLSLSLRVVQWMLSSLMDKGKRKSESKARITQDKIDKTYLHKEDVNKIYDTFNDELTPLFNNLPKKNAVVVEKKRRTRSKKTRNRRQGDNWKIKRNITLVPIRGVLNFLIFQQNDIKKKYDSYEYKDDEDMFQTPPHSKQRIFSLKDLHLDKGSKSYQDTTSDMFFNILKSNFNETNKADLLAEVLVNEQNYQNLMRMLPQKLNENVKEPFNRLLLGFLDVSRDMQNEKDQSEFERELKKSYASLFTVYFNEVKQQAKERMSQYEQMGSMRSWNQLLDQQAYDQPDKEKAQRVFNHLVGFDCGLVFSISGNGLLCFARAVVANRLLNQNLFMNDNIKLNKRAGSDALNILEKKTRYKAKSIQNDNGIDPLAQPEITKVLNEELYDGRMVLHIIRFIRMGNRCLIEHMALGEGTEHVYLIHSPAGGLLAGHFDLLYVPKKHQAEVNNYLSALQFVTHLSQLTLPQGRSDRNVGFGREVSPNRKWKKPDPMYRTSSKL